MLVPFHLHFAGWKGIVQFKSRSVVRFSFYNYLRINFNKDVEYY